MLNTDDVVFISAEFDDEQSSKIARVLNAHKIKTTTDISMATIVVKPVKKSQPQNNNLIVAISNKIEKNKDEIIELYDQLYQFMPRFEIPDIIETSDIKRLHAHTKKRKHNYFNQNQTVAKFNKIKYKHKQILFNRTRFK